MAAKDQSAAQRLMLARQLEEFGRSCSPMMIRLARLALRASAENRDFFADLAEFIGAEQETMVAQGWSPASAERYMRHIGEATWEAWEEGLIRRATAQDRS